MIQFFLISLAFSTPVLSFPIDEDSYINGYNPSNLLAAPMNNYTVLNAKEYHQTFTSAQQTVKELLSGLTLLRHKTKNEQIAFLIDALLDIPYLFTGAMGEGDWSPAATRYQPGALHVKQDPVYRFDGLDCQTFVQAVMALLHATNLNDFEKTLLRISYGAAGNPNGEIIHYFNRNNFIEGDWNPINQQNGYLDDVTSSGPLSSYAQRTAATLTRQQWFITQQKNKGNVRVLKDEHGTRMLQRFLNEYSQLQFPNFSRQKVELSYIPKQLFALKQANGSYIPNETLLDRIPTPAIVEIVRDTKTWKLDGKLIKDVIGTESSVSHIGILYRRTFKHGDLIYPKINCNYNRRGEKVCSITPVVCVKNQCTKLMMAHATFAYPNNYVFSADAAGQYSCSPFEPTGKVAYTRCNRVEQKPLFNYFTDLRYGQPGYMEEPSILGIHIEEIR